MTEDREGFLYPVVNKQHCIDCGLCESVCPIINTKEPVMPITVLAAYNKDESIRQKSSSGGIFALLAEKTIEEGGVVFGARFSKNWQVEIAYTEAVDGIVAFMGSKYVQAVVGNTYSDAENFLKQGRQVLFTGTPCQISGLKRFLQKQYDNLLTVDVVCHGVPSPKIWRRYLSEITHNTLHAINSCSFRNKDNGWKRYNFCISFPENGESCTLSSYHQENHYMRAFLCNMILRPSCHSCKSKSGRSQSDITIADFWGIQNVLSDMDDDKGTSLVLLNTSKGRLVVNRLNMKSAPVELQKAIKENVCWNESVHPHPKRTHFFNHLERSKSIVKLIDKELPPRQPIQLRIRITIHKVIHLLLSPLLGGGIGIQPHQKSYNLQKQKKTDGVII